MDKTEFSRVKEKIGNLRKYEAVGIPENTIDDLILQELPNYRTMKETEKAVKEKIHQIIAPYLGDPDYQQATESLKTAAASSPDAIRSWCEGILQSHTSSKERLPWMSEFYEFIFQKTGKPGTILDLACAMNPFAFPWMGLPRSTHYYAYDLHTPRVALINAFFSACEMEPLAAVQDILLNPPRVPADIAFFFKEAHRFEARKKGCNRLFWEQISAPILVVTLPAENMTGTHQMRNRQRDLIERNTTGENWDISEYELKGEMIFIINKGGRP